MAILRLLIRLLTISLIGITLASCGSKQPPQVDRDASKVWPKLDTAVATDPNIERQVNEMLAGMTLEQKIAQMIQPEIRDISIEDMRRYGFGSYLNGGGSFPNGDKQATPADWIQLAEDFYQASIDDSLDGSTIPTMWGTDAVHGHNNVVGATLFPHNIGLGAARNPELIEKIANITATEVMVTGIDWVFAPTVAVVRDDRWGRTYEGYSEDPEIVREYAASIVRGLQGRPGQDFLSDNRVISTVKHFVGDGGTIDGDDQGNNVSDEQTLFDIHAQGYIGGLNAGAQSVMASFNSWNGEKIHGHKYLLTDVLKTQMGFDGFVVGDWNGHGKVDGCSNSNCPQSINAGLDIFMVPTRSWKPLFENTIEQVNEGVIPMSRIDDAARRILRVKLRAGLFEKPSPKQREFSGRTELIGHADHRRVARQAVRESLVLLKNKNDILPLDPTSNILVAGGGADNIGKQSGGWSVTWQGTNNSNADFPGATSIYAGIATAIEQAGGKAELSVDGSFASKPDVAVVVFGEEPCAEGHGDRPDLNYTREYPADLALLRKLKEQGIPVVSVFISGRPMWVNAELNASDAFVAAWLPGTEGAGIADVILTKPSGDINFDFTGKLSFSWPRTPNQTDVNRFDSNYQPLLPYGFGLAYSDTNILPDDLDESTKGGDNTLPAKALFNGAVHPPWQLHLFNEQQFVKVNANSHQLTGLEYRTVDRNIQEDAFMLTMTGEQLAGMELKSGTPVNFENKLLMQSSLSFAFLQHAKPQGSVLFNMQCQPSPNETGTHNACSGQSEQVAIDIAPYLSNLAIDQWHTFSVDMKCFADKGVNLTQLTKAFRLSTKNAWQVRLTDIAITAQSAKDATISCSN
ncbi:MAG: glycoside hydrolase family 3 protein [Alteromonadaceae bacterium]|nr:glycoside hydrolase family 3 protein [Alteromonadaceae bacterium]